MSGRSNARTQNGLQTLKLEDEMVTGVRVQIRQDGSLIEVRENTRTRQ
jgi:hypothetical protein